MTEHNTLEDNPTLALSHEHQDDHDDTRTGSNENPPIIREFIACIIVSLGSLGVGYTLGYSSPTYSQLKTLGTFETGALAFFVSVPTLGAALGGAIGGLLVEVLGRKLTIMISGVLAVWGWDLVTYHHSAAVMFIGRCLTGVAMGICTLAVPLYIAEISSKRHRGMFGSWLPQYLNTGVLAVYSLGICFSWQWLAIVPCGINAALVILIVPLPETPRWLLSKNYKRSAYASLVWFRRSERIVETEYLEIEYMIKHQAKQQGILNLFRDILSPGVRRPFIITILLLILQHANGINYVTFYAESIFKEAKFVGSLPAIITGVCMILATFLSSLIVDRVGRRIILITTGVTMTISHITLGVVYYLINNESVDINKIQWVSVACVILFFMGFGIGWGPVPYVVSTEILPFRVRGPVCAIGIFLGWTTSFIVTFVFNFLKAYQAFWIFSAFCFLGVVLVIILLPETKGLSLEEIEKRFAPKRGMQSNRI